MARTQTITGQLRARVVSVRSLAVADRAAMWALFERYYADVSRPEFELDLTPKHHVILLYDTGTDELKGFSTLERFSTSVNGKRYAMVFSGDTIIEPAYWGQRALQYAFYRYILAARLRWARLPLYWFLISKGYRTYLLLSRNFVEYWPRHDKPTPRKIQELLDHVATLKFGGAFEPERGTLHFTPSHGRLREEVAPLGSDLLAAPDIRFFNERNPGHLQGDELCCLGKIDLHFAVAYVQKELRKRLRRRFFPQGPR